MSQRDPKTGEEPNDLNGKWSNHASKEVYLSKSQSSIVIVWLKIMLNHSHTNYTNFSYAVWYWIMHVPKLWRESYNPTHRPLQHKKRTFFSSQCTRKPPEAKQLGCMVKGTCRNIQQELIWWIPNSLNKSSLTSCTKEFCSSVAWGPPATAYTLCNLIIWSIPGLHLATWFDGSKVYNRQNHGSNTKNNWPTNSHDVPNIDPRNI